MPPGDISFFAPPTEAGGGGASKTRVEFANPWLDQCSQLMPTSISSALRWAEFLWLNNGTYRQASQRTSRYFITKLLITGVDSKEAKNLLGIYKKDIKIVEVLSAIGDSFLCYGNVILHMVLPFDRYFACDCGFMLPFDRAHRSKLFEFKSGKFNKTKEGCPQCGQKHPEPWKVVDKVDKQLSALRFNILSPHDVTIDYSPYSQRKVFTWKIPAAIKDGVTRGSAVILRDLPLEIIDAVVGPGATGEFIFDDDVIYHSGDPAPAGLETGGWGIPRIITNFRLACHHQWLNRMDMAIATDFVGAMRVISPDQGSAGNGAGDPLIGTGGGNFGANVKKMIAEHRTDPAAWHHSPIPLKYQMFGGEGQSLSPKEMMKAKLDELLDAQGYPAELFHGSLNIQSMPSALRVFENSWPQLVSLFNGVLAWTAAYGHRVLDMPEYGCELERVSQADDMERRHIMLQLMAGQQISPQTALRTFGIDDPREELRKTFEWQQDAAEEEKEFEEQMAKMQEAEQIKEEWAARSAGAPMDPGMSGGMGAPGPGMGGGMPPGDTSTPEGMQGEAQRVAEEIISMDATSRRSALINLKKTDEALHAIVKQKITDIEQQAKTQGVSMLRQQGQMA